MLIRIESNYDVSGIFRQTPGGAGIWKDFNFTVEPVDTCDYIIVFNHPKKDIEVTCRKGGRWLIMQEPPYEKNSYMMAAFPFYDKVFCRAKGKNVIPRQTALPWHVGKNYNELIALTERDLGGKKDSISWVTSNSNMNPGHKPRLDFMEFLKKQDIPFELYGRGIRPVEDKFDALFPSKYTIAIENYSDEDYWTEKIADAFLSWSMPVYYGCRNITSYFPSEAIIQIDINNPEEALGKIKEAMDLRLWEKNIEAIREARNLVLNRYQVFPNLYDLIKEDALVRQKQDKAKYFLPHYVPEENFMKRTIRKILRKTSLL